MARASPTAIDRRRLDPPCSHSRRWHNSRDAKRTLGGVVEWLMAPVLKTGRAKALVGSNPTPSADQFSIFEFRLSIPSGFQFTTTYAAIAPIIAAHTTSDR